jgi:hypothetical protein
MSNSKSLLPTLTLKPKRFKTILYFAILNEVRFNFISMKVARASVKEQVFDVGHLEAVKKKLRALLTSDITPILQMSHTVISSEQTMESEGLIFVINS